MTRIKMLASLVIAVLAIGGAQTLELVPVISKPLSRIIQLPGELEPFQIVSVHAKVRGYVERVMVDRGSAVKKGQLLAELSAPEMAAAIAEAESKAQGAESDRLQSEAQLAGAQSTFDRLKKAAETPGAVSGNELIQAQRQMEAAQALTQAKGLAVSAARSAVRAQRDLEAYLRIRAPFDGFITERLVHPGALASPADDAALLVIQDVAHLRLVVAVPEESSGAILKAARVEFSVPAYRELTFAGTIARISHALDQKTRTMAVELDVLNRAGLLSPGMYASVRWPLKRPKDSLWAPKTSVVTTTERTFVVRDHSGRADWVSVVKGAADDDLVELSGNLKAGDMVVRHASDEIREGSVLHSR